MHPTPTTGRAPGAFACSRRLIPLLVAGLLLTGASARAQRAADPAPGKPDDAVMLSPFVVETSEDRGYQAQSTLGGSRLKTNLKDIAPPTSAFTEQFLQDLAITNVEDLSAFMLSTERDYGEDAGGQNLTAQVNAPLRMRGLAGGSYSVNFFKADVRLDTFSVDRVDQSRGPNAVLFGVGSPGGLINLTTKRARLGKDSATVSLQVRSEDGNREEFDYNRPVSKNVAVRVAGVRSRTNSWRNHEFDDGDRLFGTAKWRVTPRTELNVEAEQGDLHAQRKRSITAYDGYTAWRDAGRQLSSVANPAAGIQAIAGKNVPWIVFDTTSGTLSNWANMASSLQRKTPDGDNIALTDFSVLPRETVLYGPGYDHNSGYTRLSAFLTQTLAPNWHLELAAMRLDRHAEIFDDQFIPGRYLMADPNPKLPNGAVNPNAGRPYVEAVPQVNRLDQRDDMIRAIMSYEKDLGWWGRHTLAGVYEHDFAKLSQYQLREAIVSANAPTLTLAESNNNRVWRRTYVDLNGPSGNIVMPNWQRQPVHGVTEQLTGNAYTTDWIAYNTNTQLNSNRGSSAIAMLQSSFWHKRIDTILGASEDRRTDYIGSQLRHDLPGFKQGNLYAIRGHAGRDSSARSYSFSGVFHVNDQIGLTYSRAENSALPSFSGRIWSPDGAVRDSRPPTPRGKSEDVGLKLDLWDHKVFLTAAYFQTSDVDDFDFSPVLKPQINPIWQTFENPGSTVPVPNGYTSFTDLEDTTTGATFDSRTQGYEVELTANPTAHFRLFANYSYELNRHYRIGTEALAYVAKWRPFWAQYASLPLAGQPGTVGSQLDVIDNAILSNYTLGEGRAPLGQMKHKFNTRGTYDFSGDALKGWSVGGGVRYTSAPVIGYTSYLDASGHRVDNVSWGSDQLYVDSMIAYRRRLQLFHRRVEWSLQLNVNNVLNNDAFVRMRVATDGQLVMYRMNAPREWILTTRFTF